MSSHSEGLKLEYVAKTLLNELPRPITLTSDNLKSLVTPCLTEKADGVRHLVIISPYGTYSCNMLGEISLICDFSNKETTIYDTEKIVDSYYWFDVLFADNVDIRHLPLLSRIKAGKNYVLPFMFEKQYFYSNNPRALRKLITTYQKEGKAKEGYIFLNLTDHYSVPPLKFKHIVTCDFLIKYISSENDGSIYVNLFVQKASGICLLPRGEAYSNTMHISAADCKKHQITERPTLEERIILECKLNAFEWSLIRRRIDRCRPNTLRTVQNNLKQTIDDPLILCSMLEQTIEPISYDFKVLWIQEAIKRTAANCVLNKEHIPVRVLFLPDSTLLRDEISKSICCEEMKLVLISTRYSANKQVPNKNGSKIDSLSFLSHTDTLEICRENNLICRRIPFEGEDFIRTIILPGELMKAWSLITIYEVFTELQYRKEFVSED